MADTIVGDLVARLRVDDSQFKAGLAEAGRDTETFGQRMNAAGKSMMGFGAKMTAGVTLPLALVGKVAFDAASDLEESINKVDVVFAENAKAIQDWSKNAAKAFGMSRQEALEAAGTFGNLFRSMDIALPVATKMSKSLVELAADLASFNNADPSEVLMALRSGLVGEVEPLRRFGVSLSAVRVEAKAFEMGLADANGELSEAAKAQARYQIILEDTALAQGDFARTSDSAANRQRILQAQFKDTAAALGQTLIPIMQTLMEVLSKVFTAFNNLSPAMQKWVVIIGLGVAAIGPLTTAVGGLIAAMSNPAVLAIGAFTAAFVATTYVLEQVFGKARDLGAELKQLSETAASLAKVADDQLTTAFQKVMLQYARTHENAAGLTITIGALTEVAKQDIGTALRLAEQYKSNTLVYNAMMHAIDKVAESQAQANLDMQRGQAHIAGVEDRLRSAEGAAYDYAGALRSIPTEINTTVNAVRGQMLYNFDGTPDFNNNPLDSFAGGGIVPGPMGKPRVIVAHGQERIWDPLDPDPDMAPGGGDTFNFYGIKSDKSPAQIIMETAQARRAAMWAMGR